MRTMKWLVVVSALCFFSCVGWCQDAPVQDAGFGLDHTTLVVKLTAPISTKSSKEGDAFTATVEDERFSGAVVEGHIKKLVKPEPGVGKQKPQIFFEFEKLTLNNQTAPIRADLKEVANSKGVKNVDEEGIAVGFTSNAKRARNTAIGAGVGAALGFALGGAKGAGIGALVGGAGALAISLKMTATGQDIDFQPGSLFTLEVSDGKRK